MGIRQLSKLIKEKCRKGVVTRKLAYYAGSRVAIDASLALYQFLIAVRSDGSALGYGDATTSHLVGLFYRTIRLVESGITPVYVFDGPAPPLKALELRRRKERRDEAERRLEAAREEKDTREIERQERRKVKVDEGHVRDSQRLLSLMGIPFVTAESESEAFCALLCKTGRVDAVATEDMDALTFGTPVLLRNLNASQAKRLDIDEYRTETILKELGLEMDSFVDLCILMGCDYCETVKGVGYKSAYELIKKHGSIEGIVENERVEVPENFDYVRARGIFRELSEDAVDGDAAETTAAETTTETPTTSSAVPPFRVLYDQIDQDALVNFLVKEKGFDETRVTNGVGKLLKAQSAGRQRRLDAFFRAV